MKLLEVNTVAVGGAIPAMIKEIVAGCASRGIEVAVAKGRRADFPGVKNIQIGTKADVIVHGVATRLLDLHGLYSRRATERFIAEAEHFNPDVVHLHNIHGYYLHYPTLFRWLAEAGRPVLWSLHDCWAFTGHCGFFGGNKGDCLRWQQQCGDCPYMTQYPASLYVDRSRLNLELKKEIFNAVPDLTLLPVSDWMSEQLASSILKDIPRQTIKLDIDTNIFSPMVNPPQRRVLAVAAKWTELKGFDFFAKLRQELPADVEIRIIGATPQALPKGFTHIKSISDPHALAEEYREAIVTVNPSYAEGYSTVNHESLACGTPVVARRRGGSLEDIYDGTGIVRTGDTDADLIAAVKDALAQNDEAVRHQARQKALALYDGKPNLKKFFDIYDNRLSKR